MKSERNPIVPCFRLECAISPIKVVHLHFLNLMSRYSGSRKA